MRAKEEQFDFGPMHFTAFALKHSVTCYGFEVTVNRTRRFDPQKAQQNDIPKRQWGILQKGQTVEHEGRTLTPDMVLGDERKGLKLVYATDTRPCEAIREHAKDADLFIGEGMYGDEEGSEKARHNKHMTMQESAQIALDANVKEHWFTHYSPSVKEPEIYLEEIEKIYPGCVIAKDGEMIDLAFADEEIQNV
jgi:ribonuclease Z